MSSINKGSTRRSDDTMNDDSDDKDTKRKSRNLSEKKRRDQFNLLVNELSSMVATGSRKMDKSTVLKSTISFLKNHNEITVRSRVNEIQEDWKPTFLTNEEFTHLILEAVDGFIIVFSSSGQVFYASESITSLLGHLPNELPNMTIYDLACEDEHTNLYNILLSPSEEQGQISFSCHLRRGGFNEKQPPCFELVHFVGYFRSDEDMVQGENRYSGYSGEADTRLVFVGTGRIETPQLIKEMPLVDSSKSEFTSRHSLEWKFLFLDHRAPPIIGYLPFELLGTSGYDYYHVDDLDNVVSCHEALMQKGEGTSCYYRFLTKGQQWIWLQTRFYITYHQWNSKPEFIVCTHRVISYVEVMKQNNRNIDDVTPHESASVDNGSSLHPWHGKGKNARLNNHGTASNCTSMSADSPTSKQSKSKPVGKTIERTLHPTPPVQPQQQVLQQPLQHPQFLEPPQYVAAIPMQSVIPTLPPTVISPLQPMDNVMMVPAQTQVHMDLQRKHAELQAIIGQQQAELRRVSEQLLMARLGFLPQSHNEPVQNMPAVMSAYHGGSASGTVSSTTTTVQTIQSNVAPSILVPVSLPVVPQQNHHHQNMQIYSPPDSNENSQNNNNNRT